VQHGQSIEVQVGAISPNCFFLGGGGGLGGFGMKWSGNRGIKSILNDLDTQRLDLGINGFKNKKFVGLDVQIFILGFEWARVAMVWRQRVVDGG